MLWAVFSQDWREPALSAYRVPTVDVLNDDSNMLVLSPGRVLVLAITGGRIEWQPVSGATQYRVERRVSGTLYEVVADVAAPATSLSHGWIVGPALFRVRAGNAAGWGPPSHPVWLPAS